MKNMIFYPFLPIFSCFYFYFARKSRQNFVGDFDMDLNVQLVVRMQKILIPKCLNGNLGIKKLMKNKDFIR